MRAILTLSMLVLTPSVLTPAAALCAPSGPQVVAVGNPLRKPVLDALRLPVTAALRQPIRFVVDKLVVQDGWAFVQAAPRTPGGAAIDFSRTDFADQAAEGLLDGDTIFALLRLQRGRWVVVTYVVAPTDIPWLAWDEEFGAPSALLRHR